MAVIEKEYSLKISTEQAQANVEELNESLKLQEDLIFNIEKELFGYQKQLKKTSKANLAGRKAINDKIAVTTSRLKEEKIGLKEVRIDRQKANDTLKDAEENAADYGGVLGMVDAKTGGLGSSIGGMTKSIGSATKGLGAMKIAIIGTGIGALLIAITSLATAFTSSEEGQDSFNKMMGVLGAITGVFTDKLASLGRGLINLFTSPIETLKNFGKSIKEFVMDKVDKVVESLGFLGSAISKLFKADFSGALADAGKGVVGLNEALNPAVILTQALVKGTKDLIKELTEEGKIAAKIADQRAKADKLDRKLITERAEANRKRAELLDKAAQKENFTAKERIGFLTEAGKIEDEITKQEIEAAQLRLDAKIAENALGDSTKEDLDEEANLRAKLIDLETAKLSKAKAVSAQILGATREEATESKALRDAKIADEKAVQDFKDALRVKDKSNKFAEIEAEKETRLKALEDLKLSETEKQQMILDVEAAFKEKKKIIEDEEQIVLDEKKAAFLEAQGIKEEESLEEQKTKALDELTRLGGTEDDKLKIIAKFNEEQENIDKIKRDAEIDMAKNTFAGIANLLGENSKAGKAAAVAAALINTYQGITAELATKTATPFGFAMKLVNIASTAAIGFKSVKSIMATKSEGGGGSASNPAAGTATPRLESIPAIPPEFNVVGAGETNQLADAIGGQTQQPIQAFVVASEVTTAQSLERNTIEGATIG